MSGARIVRSLKEAVAGNFARVTIDGQVWTRGERWQPIETAPKDGSRFLAIGRLVADEYDDRDRLIAKARVETDIYVAYFCFGSVVSFPFNGGIPTNLTFTRWMPLPAFDKAIEAGS